MVDIEHDLTSEIVCPYCGYELIDSWEACRDSEDIGLMECDSCYKSYYATRNISIDYSTSKARYGNCSSCGTSKVVIENFTSSIGTYKDMCVKCGKIEKTRLVRLQNE